LFNIAAILLMIFKITLFQMNLSYVWNMKKTIYLLVAALFFFGCGALEEKTKNKVAIEQLLEEFIACKEANSDERRACKHYTSEAICKYNGIDDFQNSDGTYLEYHDLFVAITDSPHWSFLGAADDQDVLDNAQGLANRGFPVVCVDANDKHKFAVLIIEGELSNSKKWGLKCPNSAAFFPSKRPEPYINKTLNYAFKNPKGLEIFVKK